MATIRGPPSRRPHRSRTQLSVGGIADLGGMATPPHFPPLSYHPESDMRSTPNDFMPLHQMDTHHQARTYADQDSAIYTSSDEGTLDHLSPHEHQSPVYPAWTPINDPSARPQKLPLDLTAFSLRNGYTLTNAELRMNEIFDDEMENVDRKDGLVYHHGHKCQDFDGLGTSYSFVWLDDDPESLPAQVKVWKDKRARYQRSTEGPALENYIRHMLETGSALVVERTGPESSPQGDCECILPECQYGFECMPPGHFFLTMRPGRVAWPLSKPFCFCLSCFERLWMGHFYENPGQDLGPVGIRVRRNSDTELQQTDIRADTPSDFETPIGYSNHELSLDGAMDTLSMEDTARISSLCLSRHAPPELASSSPLHHFAEEDECMANDSPRSVNSQGQWISPTNRVQHIAAFIKPGKTLSKFETAAVELWKAASFEQLKWDLHQEKAKYIREYHSGDALVDRSLNMEAFQIDDVDGDVVNEAAAEAIVKLPKSRFRGCSLADVWMVVKKEAGFI